MINQPPKPSEGPFFEIDVKDGHYHTYPTHTFEFKIEIPKNKKNSNPYPLCCSFHQNILNALKDWYYKFPVDGTHDFLLKKDWFKKEDYKHLIEKNLECTLCTEQHITHNHNKENWFDLITEYIDYLVDSFGIPHIGGNWYLDLVKYILKNNAPELCDEKRLKLKDFIQKEYFTPKEITKAPNSLNSLYVIYQKWLSLIPFNLPLFGDHNNKTALDGNFPFLRNKVKGNRYSGLAKGRLHDEASFVEYLDVLTRKLLGNIDYVKLYDEGKITDFQKTNGEFASATLKTKALRITSLYKDGELKYLETLDQWLSLHKDFFTEIQPLIGPSKKKETQKQSSIPAKFYALYHCILIALGVENPFIRNENGQLKKTEILSYAKTRYPLISEQMFYNGIRDMDLTNTNAIANTFGSGYKNKVLEISNNDSKIKAYLKKWPN